MMDTSITGSFYGLTNIIGGKNMKVRAFLKRASSFVLIVSILFLMAGCDNSTGNGNSQSGNQGAGGNDNSAASNSGSINNDSGAANNQDGINNDGSEVSSNNGNDASTNFEPQPDTSTQSNLNDYTEIKVIVSEVELDFTGRNAPILIDGEVLSDEYDYIFANLKDKNGVNAGFISAIASDMGQTFYKAVISNDQYNLLFIEGEETFTLNGETIPLAVPAQRIDSSFMIPMMVAASAVGILPVLDESTQTLSISYTFASSR
jgi:hypothetical protein